MYEEDQNRRQEYIQNIIIQIEANNALRIEYGGDFRPYELYCTLFSDQSIVNEILNYCDQQDIMAECGVHINQDGSEQPIIKILSE